jgi:hypothetical protein
MCWTSIFDHQGGREGGLDGEGKDGFAALAQLGPALPETLTALTPRGGRHFSFRHVIGSKSRDLCAGVEWFSDRKLVVVPPATGRAWLTRAEIAGAPDWLKALVLAPRAQAGNDDHRTFLSGPPVTDFPRTDREVPRDIYFLILSGMPKARLRTTRQVRGLWRNLAAKQQGRNDGLNFTAWKFRTFVTTGDLDRQVAAKLLWLACAANGYLTKDKGSVAKAKEVIRRVLVDQETVP